MKDIKPLTPGPGQYLIPCAIAHVPKYTSGKFNDGLRYV
jgi:hypothetical protein